MEEGAYHKRALDKIKEARRQKYLDACRKRLANIAEIKIKTSFIGALDAFEKEFGDLWGFGEPQTDKEQEYYDKWQIARTNVLNNGNNQLRALLNDISNNIIEWNRYSTTFINKESQNEESI